MKAGKKRIKITLLIKRILQQKVSKWFLILLVGLVMFAAMFSNVRPQKLDVKLFSVADHTIVAPATVIDEEMTEKKYRKP
jgi:hypothetical protein